MELNLLEMVKRSMGVDFTDVVRRTLGESEGATRAGLDKLLPILVGGVAAKGATIDGAQSLLALTRDADLPDLSALDASSIKSQGVNGLVSTGTSLATNLFGERTAALAGTLADRTGLKRTSALSLIALATPLVLAAVKKCVSERGLDPAGVMGMLADQGQHLPKMDDGLAAALTPKSSGEALGAAGRRAAEAVPVVSARGPESAAGAAGGVHAMRREKSGFARALPWVIAAAAGLLALQYFVRGRSPSAPEPVAVPPAAAVSPAPSTPEAARAPVTGAVIARVYFHSGEAAINRGTTTDTIAQAARTIKRDSSRVAVTGYADASGNPAANAELAKERAKAVKQALMAEGVPEDAIALQPPVSMTGSGSDEEARRVEIGLMGQ